jgi:hypothetical protein
MKFPLGRKGLVLAGAAVGALAFWRVRAKRQEREDREWESEVTGAIDEGRSGAEGTGAGGPS